MAKTPTEEEPVRSGWREIWGTILLTLGLLLLLGILSYKPSQVAFYSNTSDWRSNWIGIFGAYMAATTFIFFGVCGYAIPVCMMWIGGHAVARSWMRIAPRLLWMLLGLLCLAGLVDMNTQFWLDAVERLNIGSPGGVLGEALAQRTLGHWIGYAGAGIVFSILMVLAFVRMFNLHIVDAVVRLW